MRTRFSLRLSPFTSFPFSQARKHNWPEYSLWDLGPICIVGQLICLGPWSHLRRRSAYLLGPRSHLRRRSGYLLGPRSHLRRRSAYLPGTMVPPPSPVRLSAWDHGPTCIAGQVICLGPRSHFRRWSGYLLGPRSHLRRRSGYLPGTTVPPPSSVRLSAWDHGPTCIVGTLLVWDNGSINACHEQVLTCRHQPVERSNHAAGRLLQAMVKALLGSERSMLSEICKI
ncbi:Uncharacterised protein [Klebsiella pneumoniae]|nr:Uncharacterised protein [Klebsiella pneumoniae]